VSIRWPGDSDRRGWTATPQNLREAVLAPSWRRAASSDAPSKRSQRILDGAPSPRHRLKDLQPELRKFSAKVWSRIRRAPAYHGPEIPFKVSRETRVLALLIDAAIESGKVSILERDLAKDNVIAPEYLDLLELHPHLAALFASGVAAVLAAADLTPIQRQIVDYVLAGTPGAKAISGYTGRSPWSTSTQLDRAHKKLRRLADERLCLVCGVHITGKASKVYCGDACRWAARWAA
jgi:hypothetical protein